MFFFFRVLCSESKMQTSRDNVEIRETPNKGEGVFALKKITAGDVALTDGPYLLCSDKRGFYSWAWSLTWNIITNKMEKKLKVFCKTPIEFLWNPLDEMVMIWLAKNYRMKREDILDIYWRVVTNDLITGGVIVLYRTGCKVNHSCKPNCVLSFSDDERSLFILTAERDIGEGEEIVYSYAAMAQKVVRIYAADNREEQLLFQDLNPSEKNSLVFNSYGFNCQCGYCCPGPDTSQIKSVDSQIRQSLKNKLLRICLCVCFFHSLSPTHNTQHTTHNSEGRDAKDKEEDHRSR